MSAAADVAILHTQRRHIRKFQPRSRPRDHRGGGRLKGRGSGDGDLGQVMEEYKISDEDGFENRMLREGRNRQRNKTDLRMS